MNDQTESRKLWANKGEAVTCIKGHPICHAAKHLYVGEGHSPANFDNWQQPEPNENTKITEIRCTKCRGVWVRQGPSSYQFHFGVPPHGGWR